MKEKTSDVDISELPKYKRQPCINCDYKLICAGECEKTINKKCQELGWLDD